jgi:hypothetical protein
MVRQRKFTLPVPPTQRPLVQSLIPHEGSGTSEVAQRLLLIEATIRHLRAERRALRAQLYPPTATTQHSTVYKEI